MITGQPHGRRCPMQPPPLAAQFEDRRGGKPRQRLRYQSTTWPYQRPRLPSPTSQSREGMRSPTPPMPKEIS